MISLFAPSNIIKYPRKCLDPLKIRKFVKFRILSNQHDFKMPFSQGTAPFFNQSTLFVQWKHYFWKIAKFESLKNGRTLISGPSKFLKILNFTIFLIVIGSKHFAGYFIMFDFHILGLSSRSTFRIYIALYGFKLVSASYWRLKINKKSGIFVILQFFPFLTPVKSKKKDFVVLVFTCLC